MRVDGGCVIEWLFIVDLVEGLVLDDLVGKYRVGLQIIGRKIEGDCDFGAKELK
ncbi:hypothetical protein RYX36_001306, partial [Vicia faba]